MPHEIVSHERVVRPRMLAAAMMLLLLWWPSVVFPAPREGESLREFIRLCEAPSRRPLYICRNLIGAIVGADNMIAYKRPDLRRYCPPPRFSEEEARILFLNWVREQKVLPDITYPSAIRRALEEAFRCMPEEPRRPPGPGNGAGKNPEPPQGG